MTEIKFFAPGKLVICGEYAVLAPGGEGLAAAVGSGVAACLRPAARFGISTRLLEGGPVAFSWDGSRMAPDSTLDEAASRALRFVRASSEEVLGYVERRGCQALPFGLELSPEGDMSGTTGPGSEHLGLGLSAASTVAAGAAILAHHGVEPLTEQGRTLLFTLARAAHTRAQEGHGSGIDVAASVYGGVIRFRRGEKSALINRVDWPRDLLIVAGWTGRKSDTRSRVEQIEAFRNAAPRWYEQFVNTSGRLTRAILDALQRGDRAAVLHGIAAHRRLLQELGESAGLEMEPAELKRLARLAARFGAGKQSGAGGGDCGIIVLQHPSFLRDVVDALRESGLVYLPLQVPVPGARRVE